jgi:protein SCO1/2
MNRDVPRLREKLSISRLRLPLWERVSHAPAVAHLESPEEPAAGLMIPIRFGFLLLPLTLFAASCATSPLDGSSAVNRTCCVSNSEPAVVFTDRSIYQLESRWTNDSGRSVELGHMQGRPQVVAMFFTACTYACPILVHDMRRIEAALPESARTNAGFTLITIDCERDTPEILRAYRASRRLDSRRWTLLRGAPDDTLELAALLGVKFKREASGQFAHSNLITILNSKGEIIHQLSGLNQNVEEAVKLVIGANTEAIKLQPSHD